MSNRVQGWLFIVPSRYYISFFAADSDSLKAENFPWMALLAHDDSLTNFVTDMKARVAESPAPCLCFCIDQRLDDLKTWFENSFEIVDLCESNESLPTIEAAGND